MSVVALHIVARRLDYATVRLLRRSERLWLKGLMERTRRLSSSFAWSVFWILPSCQNWPTAILFPAFAFPQSVDH